MQHQNNQIAQQRLRLPLFLGLLLLSSSHTAWCQASDFWQPLKHNSAQVTIDYASYSPLPGKSRVSRRVVVILYLNTSGVKHSPPWLRGWYPARSVKMYLLSAGVRHAVKVDKISGLGFDKVSMQHIIICHGSILSKQALPYKAIVNGTVNFADKTGRYKHTLPFRLPVEASHWSSLEPVK